MSLNLLSLDQSFPIADSYHATNTSGIIRFIAAGDPLQLPQLQRVQGDIVNRFNLIQDKINEIVVEIKTNPAFPAFDDSPYIKTDGSRAFAAVVEGITPTAAAHISTKGYVDQQDTSVLASVSALQTSLNTYLTSASIPFYSPWSEHTWQAGTQVHLELTLTIPSGLTPNYASVSGVFLIERLDIAQVTSEVPSPDPEYVYNVITPGANFGFKVDSLWLDPVTGKVHALIPNVVNFASYSGITQYSYIQVPRTRHLRAVVTTPTL